MKTKMIIVLFVLMGAVLALKAKHDSDNESIDNELRSSETNQAPEVELEGLVMKAKEREVDVDSDSSGAGETPMQLSGRVVVLQDSGAMSSELVDGVLTIATGDTGSVRQNEEDEQLQFDSFVMLPGGRILEPTAMRGDQCKVVNGAWSIAIPESDKLAVKFTMGGIPLKIVSGSLLTKGSVQSEIVVVHHTPLEITAVDSESGENIEYLDIVSNTMMPMGRRISMVVPDGAVAPHPEHENHSLHKTCPAPPSFGKVLAQRVKAPVSLEPFEFLHQLWVRSEGYQWEQVEVDQRSKNLTIPLRKARNLQIEVEHSGWDSHRLSLVVRRGGLHLARWRDIAQHSTFTLSDLGIGSVLIELVWQGDDFRRVLLEKVVKIDKDGDAFAFLESVKDVNEWRGVLNIEVLGGASVLEQAGRKVHPTVIVSPVFDGERLVLDRAKQRRLADLTSISEEKRTLLLSGIPEGDYTVVLLPYGVRRVVSVEAGSESKVTIDISELGRLNVWPNTKGLSKERKDSISSLRIVWERMDDDTGINSKTLRFSPLASITRDGGWVVRTPPGGVRFYLVDPEGRVACRQEVEVEHNVIDVVAEFDGDENYMAHVTIDGLSPAEYEVCASQALLGVPGDMKSGLWPVSKSFEQTGDLEYSLELTYAVPKEWMSLALSLETPIYPISFETIPGTLDVDDNTIYIRVEVIR